MTTTEEILSVVEQSVSPDRFREQHWEGSFDEYLKIIREDPKVTRTSFQRLYDMIMEFGRSEYIDSKKKLIHYNFFDDPIENGKDAIFGLDIPLMRLVNVIKSAALGYGTERRVIRAEDNRFDAFLLQHAQDLCTAGLAEMVGAETSIADDDA